MKTVADLITELQKLDPALPVLVDGYEGGYIEPHLRQLQVVYTGPRSYMGDHDDAENKPWDIEDGAVPFQALILSRLGPI